MYNYVTNYVQELYAENQKIFVKEIKEYPNKWRDVLCSWIERFNTVKKYISPNLVPAKTPVSFYTDIPKMILKYIYKNSGIEQQKQF